MTAREISQQIAEGLMEGIDDVATLRKIKLFGNRLEREISRYVISEIKSLGENGEVGRIQELENQIKETYNVKSERISE